jgi:environmental stress-induced protein Ves
MPWKNGGGETIEVSIAPDHSTLETFDWRISRARIDRSGPFSPFSGIDRTLVAIDGKGIVLRFDDAEPVVLSPGDPPLSFVGEAGVESEMLEGVVTELNVMTRRDRFHHRVEVLADNRPTDVMARGDEIVTIFAAGRAIVDTAAGKSQLSANDAVLLSAADGMAIVTPEPGSRLFLIQIEPSAN